MSLTVSPPAYDMERRQAAIEELYRMPDNGSAEIIQGRVVHMSPTGAEPGRTAGKTFISLSQYEERRSQAEEGISYAFGGNVGFLVGLPN